MKKLIKEYKEARERFIECLDKFPIEKREEASFDEWSVKDILAHIIEWERQSIQKLKDIENGRASVWIKDVNVFNETAVSRYKKKSWDDVYREFLQSGLEMIKIYSKLGNNLWQKQSGPKPQDTPARFLEQETRHYEGEHLRQLMQGN